MGITKDEFFKYIGEGNSLNGYSRSYILVLYKILFEDVIYKRRSYISKVAEKFKQFYVNRKESGKIADKDVDIKIANIETSSIEQIISVIIINPYKHIHENGYLNIWQDKDQNRYFVFDDVLMKTVSMGEWLYLLVNIRKKIDLYFSRIDESSTNEDLKAPKQIDNTNEKIIKVDFAFPDNYYAKDYLPVIFIYDKCIYSLSGWEEFLKISFYLFAKTQAGNEFFNSTCGEILKGIGRRISKNDTILNNPCKFSKDMYVECLKTKPFTYIHDSYKFASLNLSYIKYVKDVLAINFDLWLCEAEYIGAISTERDILISKLSSKDKRNKMKIIRAKNFIARINEEILSDAEKFYLRIEKEYDKKILLGDIVINEDEENILKQHMINELKRLNCSSISFHPARPKIFAFGLVRFAMKFYSDGKFWPYFKDEYGIAVNGNIQHEIHYWFKSIMGDTGKTYDDSLPQKIDNISLHSFVTDKCSRQFFNYLFDFWRKELNRNIDNMYGEGNELFKELIKEIKRNNSVGINNVMKHTSMAVELNEKSCTLRIRRFLKLIDECFWNGDVIPKTGNRFNELLRKWMDIPNGRFQSEYQIKTRRQDKRGQKLLSKPQLQVKFTNSVFSLCLPQQILPHCTSVEHPKWEIEADGIESILIEPDLMQGSVFLYTEEIETAIPPEMIFKQIVITLQSETHKFARFSIKNNEVRFFDENGKYLDHSISLPEGNLFCYSAEQEIPQMLYKEKQIAQPVNEMYVGVYQAEKGDIMVFHNNHAVQVGEKICEGINDAYLLEGVRAIKEDAEYPVYSKLPRILFKAPKDSLSGIAIIIWRTNSEKSVYKLTDYHYNEFKIDNTLDETYAYIIDLNHFIPDEGCYQVSINVPNSQKQYNFNFCYIKDFSFEFDDAPYIFKDTGSICFDRKLNVEVKGDKWELTENVNRLNINFNPQSAEFSTEYIDNWKLKLNYNLPNETVNLKIDIPIFLWKYQKTDDWSISKPADIFLKNLPNKLYIDGPFNFNDKNKNKLFVDLKNSDNEDTDIFAETVKDEDYFMFSFGNFKSWLNQDIVRRQIKLKLNGNDFFFVDVYCRSIVLNHNLVGDFEAKKLYGAFDIFGDGEYTVTIKKDNSVIEESIELVDGKFEIETDVSFGYYTIVVYELFEDDSGFESFNVEIGSYDLKIKDLKDLKQSTMQIKEIKDINGKYAPIQLEYLYQLEDIKKINYETLQQRDIELLGLWREDLGEEQLCELPIYECYICNNFSEKFKGLLIFYSRVDIKSAVILELTQDSAGSLYYDSYRHRLISEAQANKFKRYERFKRTIALQDDMYTFIID